jgi:ankyrin repeat protein
MEETLLRFSHIGEGIFKKLSNKSLAKCRTVDEAWEHFISNEKFYKQRVKYETIQKEKDEIGRTPLHRAAEDGKLSECKMIIDHVENKHPKNGYGTTALHLAAQNGHLSVCQLIVANVENKNPGDVDGWTPLHWAALNGDLEICKSIMKNGHLSICQLIINNMENKNPGNINGWTPLHWAALNGHLEICKFIMKNVQDKNPSTTNDYRSIKVTPLSLATSHGHHQLADYIKSELLKNEK